MSWLYYALPRLIRPARVVVIGSWRGFVPLVGRALADNGEGGEVIFIDPSLVDDFWADPAAVQAHFARYAVRNVRHFRMTTQAFVHSPVYAQLGELGLLSVDGLHTAEQAQFDYLSFRSWLGAQGMVAFHDSLVVRFSRIYGEAYEHRVRDYVAELRGDPGLELFDFPFGDGLTLMRRRA